MAKDRLKIKINDHLTIAARDIRNIEIRTTVYETKNGEKVSRSKTAYASTLGAALKICASDLPLFSNAKNLDQLKADFIAFENRIEELVNQYKLPNAKEFLGESEENPKGLYGEDLREKDKVSKSEDDFDDDDFEDTPSSDDSDWDDDDEDWD